MLMKGQFWSDAVPDDQGRPVPIRVASDGTVIVSQAGGASGFATEATLQAFSNKFYTATGMVDGAANPTVTGEAVYLLGFNGTTWDRLRSTIANGLVVDVSRVQGTVNTGGLTDAQLRASAVPITEAVNTSVIEAIDISSDPAAFYFGSAPRGSASSASVWSIQKMPLVSGKPSGLIKWATGVKWDDRTTETYT